MQLFFIFLFNFPNCLISSFEPPVTQAKPVLNPKTFLEPNAALKNLGLPAADIISTTVGFDHNDKLKKCGGNFISDDGLIITASHCLELTFR
jgi:hypothetical protein